MTQLGAYRTHSAAPRFVTPDDLSVVARWLNSAAPTHLSSYRVTAWWDRSITHPSRLDTAVLRIDRSDAFGIARSGGRPSRPPAMLQEVTFVAGGRADETIGVAWRCSALSASASRTRDEGDAMTDVDPRAGPVARPAGEPDRTDGMASDALPVQAGPDHAPEVRTQGKACTGNRGRAA